MLTKTTGRTHRIRIHRSMGTAKTAVRGHARSLVIAALLALGAAPAAVTAQPALLISRGTTAIDDGDTVFFGSAFVGDTVPVALTLRNVGNTTLTFNTQVPLVGPAANDFVLGNLPTQIAPGGFGVFGMNFTPTAAGQRQAFITISSNGPDVTLTLMGIGATPITDCNGNGVDDATDIANGTSIDCDVNGVPDECQTDSDNDGTIDACEQVVQAAPEMLIANALEVVAFDSTLRFDATAVGQSTGIALTIRNNGDGPLVFDGPAEVAGPAAADYVLGNLPAQIAPGGFGVFGITFSPSTQGQRVAVVTINSNDPTFPSFGFIVSGTALAPLNDCNANGREDADDIADGTSEDCNANGVPDECELDSDNDGTIDACEVDEPVQPQPPVNEEPVQEDPDQDPNQDEEPMPVIEEDPFGNDQDDQQDGNEQVVVPVSGFCGAGVAMNVPMMMLGLLATGASRRFFTAAARTRR